MGAITTSGAGGDVEVARLPRFGGTGYRDAVEAYEHGCSFVTDWAAALELADEYRRRDGVPMAVLSVDVGYQVMVPTVACLSDFAQYVAAVTS